jgi:uncharacterized protein (DUF58 family)
MIVPTHRLLILYGLTIPLLTLLPALRATAAIPAFAAGLILILIALLDAAFGPRRLRNIGIGLPPMVRMTRGREGSLELSLTNTDRGAKTLRLGLPLPREISSPQEDLLALLPKDTEHLRVVCPCTPLERGQFHIHTCYLETKSPLGLWACRGLKEVACEIRVYPNLAQERNNLAALFLNRGGYGIHVRRQHGKGKEFEKLREYIPGDGFDEIHWKATAKRRHPITKVFQIERTQEVYVAIDISRLSARSAGAKEDSGGGDPEDFFANDSCLERFIAAALVVGLAAQKQGDLFGVLSFSDSVHEFLRARGGKSHYSACREHLFNLHPRMVNPDFEEFSTFIRLKLRRRALIILLTSLDDPVLAKSFTRTVELITRHHLVMVNMLRPGGARPIFSNENITSPEEIYRELSGHTLWHHLREIERTLARHGVTFGLLDHERLCVDLVSQYMNVKQRQLL